MSCSYDGDTTKELQHAGESAFVIEPSVPSNGNGNITSQAVPQPPPTPPEEYILNMLNYPLALHETDEVYRISKEDLDMFRRFQDRTVYTIGTKQTVPIYREVITKLGCEHCYLTHVLFTIVLMHDRYLPGQQWRPPLHKETFHHYHGTAIFNSMLSKSIPQEEKDAMWGAAALLGAITIASIDGTTPEECWPIAPASPSDLDWLRMSDGKKEVWRLADPMREDSIWRPALTHEHTPDMEAQTDRRADFETLLPCLTKLYNFDASADGSDDPYHTACSIIVRLLPMKCTHANILWFLSFLGHMAPAYRQLLHKKDPKAILLLAWWYAEMLDYPAWWIQRRAMLECKAICVFLQQRFMPWSEIGKLLDFPKMMCGLAVSPEYARRVEEVRS